jgi:hypothetical protein
VEKGCKFRGWSVVVGATRTVGMAAQRLVFGEDLAVAAVGERVGCDAVGESVDQAKACNT